MRKENKTIACSEVKALTSETPVVFTVHAGHPKETLEKLAKMINK